MILPSLKKKHLTIKKLIETTGVTYRQYDLCFYWTGVEPTHKITAVKKSIPGRNLLKDKRILLILQMQLETL